VWADYLEAKSGKTGILTPWKTMNEWTGGWYPQDVSFVVARQGVGKSFVAIHLAAEARRSGHKTLFITGEMSKADIAKRFFAIEFKTQYGAMRKGRLSFIEEERFKQQLDAYTPPIDMEIVDGSTGMNSVDVERAIERSEAELIVVDATYRIKARQKTRDRFENMAYVTDDLKTYAQVYNKSIVATTQLNRSAAKSKSVGPEDVALSDVIGWNATNMFGLKQDETHMEVTPMKVREAARSNDPMKLKWDFVTMDFSEMTFEESNRGGKDDDDPADAYL
jgi:replicative DNA helicase